MPGWGLTCCCPEAVGLRRASEMSAHRQLPRRRHRPGVGPGQPRRPPRRAAAHRPALAADIASNQRPRWPRCWPATTRGPASPWTRPGPSRGGGAGRGERAARPDPHRARSAPRWSSGAGPSSAERRPTWRRTGDRTLGARGRTGVGIGRGVGTRVGGGAATRALAVLAVALALAPAPSVAGAALDQARPSRPRSARSPPAGPRRRRAHGPRRAHARAAADRRRGPDGGRRHPRRRPPVTLPFLPGPSTLVGPPPGSVASSASLTAGSASRCRTATRCGSSATPPTCTTRAAGSSRATS